MHYQSLVSSACLIGAGLVLCGPARAADDAAAICKRQPPLTTPRSPPAIL